MKIIEPSDDWRMREFDQEPPLTEEEKLQQYELQRERQEDSD